MGKVGMSLDMLCVSHPQRLSFHGMRTKGCWAGELHASTKPPNIRNVASSFLFIWPIYQLSYFTQSCFFHNFIPEPSPLSLSGQVGRLSPRLRWCWCAPFELGADVSLFREMVGRAPCWGRASSYRLVGILKALSAAEDAIYLLIWMVHASLV